jgi:hypothetical protein
MIFRDQASERRYFGSRNIVLGERYFNNKRWRTSIDKCVFNPKQKLSS